MGTLLILLIIGHAYHFFGT